MILNTCLFLEVNPLWIIKTVCVKHVQECDMLEQNICPCLLSLWHVSRVFKHDDITCHRCNFQASKCHRSLVCSKMKKGPRSACKEYLCTWKNCHMYEIRVHLQYACLLFYFTEQFCRNPKSFHVDINCRYLVYCFCLLVLTDVLVCWYYRTISAYRRYIGISVYVLWFALMLRLFLRPEKNTLTSDLKWCSCILCPAEGDSVI